MKEAYRNEIAAARLAAQRVVSVQARVDDLSFVDDRQQVTASSSIYDPRSSTGLARTRSVVVKQPYAALTTENETWVTCFLAPDAASDALSKGTLTAMIGRFYGFERIGAKLRVVLVGCKVDATSNE